ncbi:MAG TPA: peptidyl-prolyl cis-trans isomerase [Candidatus Polarisedimenticolia bacterium]|nr:peptidyl-prolyl cis-trans isomerase [Candidatus Polarisedimenticolia bacterium]
MLDLMRQANRRKWFLYILILPVVFSFVLAVFAIYGGASDPGSGSAGAGWIARVDGEEISTRDLQRQRQQIEGRMRQMYPDQFEQFAASADFDSMALGQLLGQTLAYREAVRLGLRASDQEIGQAIKSAPIFQRDGRFIGRDQYVGELRARGYDVSEYEREIGKELAVDKLRSLLGSMAQVTPADVERAFREEGESAEVDYVLLKDADFPASGEPSAREIESYHRENQEKYLSPEKRSAEFVLLEREPLLQAVTVADAEIQAEYDARKDTTYTSPEQRRASHILFKVPPGAPAAEASAIEARAAEVLGQIRAGGDFAQLAQQHSEDTSAAQGGDLGWFGRGRMVPEFEQPAFSMAEGQVSDLVRSQFGFHIIKVTGSRPAGVRPLEEVKDPIRQQLAFRKAQEELDRKAAEFSGRLAQQVSPFEKVASELGYAVRQTGLIAEGDPIPGLDAPGMAASEIFRLEPGRVSEAIRTPQGMVFARVLEVKSPQPAPLASVRDQVTADLVASRSRRKAREAARAIAAAGADGFKEAADARKAAVSSTGEFSRSSAPAVFDEKAKEIIFSTEAGRVSGPLDAADGVVVVKVIKRGPASPEETERIRASLREQLLSRQRDSAFTALLGRLQKSAAIEVNDQLLSDLRRASR